MLDPVWQDHAISPGTAEAEEEENMETETDDCPDDSAEEDDGTWYERDSPLIQYLKSFEILLKSKDKNHIREKIEDDGIIHFPPSSIPALDVLRDVKPSPNSFYRKDVSVLLF